MKFFVKTSPQQSIMRLILLATTVTYYISLFT